MQEVLVPSLVGCIAILHAYNTFPHVHVDALGKRKALASSIRTCMSLLWPSVLFGCLSEEDRSSAMVVLPLGWNFGVWALDHYLLHNATSHTPEVPASLRLEPSSVTALGFGLCGLLGAKPDGTYAHLFLTSIVGCMILVLPSHNLAPGCVEEQVFESIQKGALIWCIGLLVAGVVFTRRQTCKSIQPALR